MSGLAKTMFYSELLRKKAMCFGFGVEPDQNSLMFESFPWALPDNVFRQVYGDLKEGKGQAYEPEYSWSDVTDKVGNLSKSAAEYGPAVGLAAYFLKKFAATYAPELVALAANPLALATGTAIIWSAVEINQFAAKLQNQETLQRYDIDAERRKYDSSSPLISEN